MARCAYHPDIETNLRCAECERYICPKDMVTTPVGYKCRDCARPAKSQLVRMRPDQLAKALAAAALAGGLGGFLLGMVGFGFFFVWLIFGAAVGEAVRRASGGHRGPAVAAIAAAGVLVGAFLGGFGPFGLVLSVAGAVGAVSR